jgi:hypothetical protein
VVHDQLTKELIEYIRTGLRLLVQLSEGGMVGNKGINYVHTASNHVVGLNLSSFLQIINLCIIIILREIDISGCILPAIIAFLFHRRKYYYFKDAVNRRLK